MKEIREIIYVVSGQFKAAFLSARVWTGYILSFIILLPVSEYLKYSGRYSIQVCEAFIIFQGNREMFFVAFLGLIVIISEAPYLNARTELIMYRVSRNVWRKSMMIYIALQTICYVAVLSIVCMIFSMSKSYVGNVWSMSFSRATQIIAVQDMDYHFLSAPNSMLMKVFSPWQCFIYTVVLMCAYGYVLALLIFILNFKFSKILGICSAVGVHLVSFASARGVFYLPLRWTPGSLANINLLIQGYSYGITFWYAIIFFMLLSLLFDILIKLIVQHSDIKFEGLEIHR